MSHSDHERFALTTHWSHRDFESSDGSSGTAMLDVLMNDDKKHGVTHIIRERLNFLDERLWKRFSARRLELIDTLDLSSKKASEQEDEIKKVAEILRLEFKYDPQYFGDFDKLVRAAVQSVRRNRKRSTKTKRGSDAKRQHSSSEVSPEYMIKEENGPSGERDHFLSEIARLHTDAHDEVYDMNYPRTKLITNQDQSRSAIGSIIKPLSEKPELTKPHLDVMLPPLPNLAHATQTQIENEKELQAIRVSLLLLMKRSKLCLETTLKPKGDFLRILGESSIRSISALVFEKSFSNLNQTSIEYLLEKLSLALFLAKFYRSLEPDSPTNDTLNDETACITLQTLIGCCVNDFGFDIVLYPLGEAFYRSILLEYPLVLKTAQPFLRNEIQDQHQSAPVPDQNTLQSNGFSLNSLATVATELRHHAKPLGPYTGESKKLVELRFLTSSLKFSYTGSNSAPPRFVEMMENAKLAFKLNENQIFGLRNVKTGILVTSDSDLEKIFENEDDIKLEIFPQGFQAIPIHELANAVTPTRYTDDSPKIILPPPFKQTPPPPVLPNPLGGARGNGFQNPPPPNIKPPVLAEFQPLL